MTVVDSAAAQLRELRRVFLHHVGGMTDEEFLWEPVDGCWSVRKRDDRWVLEVAHPAPEPAPLTTIAWLTAHMTQFLFAAEHAIRDQPIESWPRTFGVASDAISEWTACLDGVVAALSTTADEDLARHYTVPRAAEPASVGVIVWRAIYEAIHHGAEVTRMRQMYANLGTYRRP